MFSANLPNQVAVHALKLELFRLELRPQFLQSSQTPGSNTQEKCTIHAEAVAVAIEAEEDSEVEDAAVIEVEAVAEVCAQLKLFRNQKIDKFKVDLAIVVEAHLEAGAEEHHAEAVVERREVEVHPEAAQEAGRKLLSCVQDFPFDSETL